MDIGRFGYTQNCQFFAGGGPVQKIRWYRAAPGAKVFPTWHSFGSNIWMTAPWTAQGIGEQYGSPPRWNPGATPPTATGEHYCGTVSNFQEGIPYNPTGPVYPRDPWGLLAACSSFTDNPLRFRMGFRALNAEIGLGEVLLFSVGVDLHPGFVPWVPAGLIGYRVGTPEPAIGPGLLLATIRIKLDVRTGAAQIGAGPQQLGVTLDTLVGGGLVDGGAAPIGVTIGLDAPISINLLAGLTAFWPMHEPAGSNRVDSTGSGNDFVEQGGTVASAAGLIGNAASFTMFGNYLSVPTNFFSGSDAAFSIWFNSTSPTEMGLIFGDNAGNPSGAGALASGTFGQIGPNGGNDGIGATTGVWHHLVVSISGANQKVFLDGILVLIGGPSAAAAGGTVTKVGTMFNTFSEADGLIQLFGIWWRHLTDGNVLTPGDVATGEVGALYNAGSGLDYPF